MGKFFLRAVKKSNEFAILSARHQYRTIMEQSRNKTSGGNATRLGIQCLNIEVNFSPLMS